jgi:hypothetical protein
MPSEQAQRCTPVVPATREAEAKGSLEMATYFLFPEHSHLNKNNG